MGNVSQRTNIHTDIVYLYNQVNQKLKKFDYKYKISTSCGGLFFLNLIVLGQLVFLVTRKEPGEMSLTKVVQRLQYCGNYNLFHNLKNLNAMRAHHYCNLLMLCGSVGCSSIDN